MKGITVLKLGGELLEGSATLQKISRSIARMAKKGPLVIVHGGGREIDAALAQASIPKHQVDGLRITDHATLQVVVSVLAGLVNTRLVAAINAAGAPAVGLTGADAGVAPVKPARPHKATNGELVDLGLVGEPLSTRTPKLIGTLLKRGYVPVVASIGAARDGRLFNVNADTLAGSLAARMGAGRLVIAGVTPGVLAKKKTIASLNKKAIEALVSSGTATAGMVAKLRACRAAAEGGVRSVVIVDGRKPKNVAALVAGKLPRKGPFTRIT